MNADHRSTAEAEQQSPARPAPASFHDFRDVGDPLTKVDRFAPQPVYEDRGQFGRGRV